MGFRLLIEILLLLSPFIVFGLYRLAVAEAEQDGRKPWPVTLLFGAGLALAVIGWFAFMAIFDDRGTCYGEPVVINGDIERPVIECNRNVTRIGVPDSDDPGGEAPGVFNPDQPRSSPPRSVGGQRTPQSVDPVPEDVTPPDPDIEIEADTSGDD